MTATTRRKTGGLAEMRYAETLGFRPKLDHWTAGSPEDGAGRADGEVQAVLEGARE
jgi:hypothetical protein